jgi:hypothetical protein
MYMLNLSKNQGTSGNTSEKHTITRTRLHESHNCQFLHKEQLSIPSSDESLKSSLERSLECPPQKLNRGERRGWEAMKVDGRSYLLHKYI